MTTEMRERARECAEKIRKAIYDLWVHSRKSSRTEFGTASFQAFAREAAEKELAHST